MQRLWRRLQTLLTPGRDRAWAEEMQFHLEQKQAEGLSRREAERILGNDLLLRERSREAWGWTQCEAWWRDLRLAGRLLRRAPGFAAVAMFSLALGIGVNLAVFTLVDAITLHRLPVPQPQQLVRLDWTSNQWSEPHGWGTNYTDAQGRDVESSFSYPTFAQWQQSRGVLAGLLAYRPLSHLDVGSRGQAEPATGVLVSGSFQQVLGIAPALGRGINDSDLTPGAPPVAVLSYNYWQQRFGGDRGVLGRTIQLNQQTATVVGVQAVDFHGLEIGQDPDVELPMALVESPLLMAGFNQPPHLADGSYWFVEVVGRMRPGVTLERARAELSVGFAQSVKALPVDGSNHGDHPQLLAFSAANGVNNLGEDVALPMEILMALTGLVLLIVLANMVNLLLARGAARRQELAVRVAIGAGRAALVRQLLAESFLLALGGGLLSLPLGVTASGLMQRMFVPVDIHLRARLDGLSLALAAGLAGAAGLLLGLLPALRLTRRGTTDPSAAVAEKGGRRWLSEVLLMGQLALCLIVLSLAGVFGRTLRNLQAAPKGLDARQVTLFQLDPPLEGYSGARLATYYERVTERLRSIPGVEGAAITSIIPGGDGASSTHDIGLAPNQPPSANPRTFVAAVTPGYFDVYHIRRLSGRDFTASDDAAAPVVAIVNAAFAARFPGAIALGRTLYAGSGKGMKTVQIVGVVANAVYEGVRNADVPVFYMPVAQQLPSSPAVVVRSGLPTAALQTAIRGAMAGVDANVPVYGVETQQEAMAASYDSQVMMAGMSSMLGGLAVLLAAIGLYGLMAYNVTRRRREIGVRIALGARPGTVLGMILRQSVVLALVGAACGLPLAWIATRAAGSLLFGVRPGDPMTLAGVSLFLGLVALAAAWMPARRAASVDPLQALHSD